MSGTFGATPPALTRTIKPADRIVHRVHEGLLRIHGSRVIAPVGGDALGESRRDRARERTTGTAGIRSGQSRPTKLVNPAANPKTIDDLMTTGMPPL